MTSIVGLLTMMIYSKYIIISNLGCIMITGIDKDYIRKVRQKFGYRHECKCIFLGVPLHIRSDDPRYKGHPNISVRNSLLNVAKCCLHLGKQLTKYD